MHKTKLTLVNATANMSGAMFHDSPLARRPDRRASAANRARAYIGTSHKTSRKSTRKIPQSNRASANDFFDGKNDAYFTMPILSLQGRTKILVL